jgi:hypothetical protein
MSRRLVAGVVGVALLGIAMGTRAAHARRLADRPVSVARSADPGGPAEALHMEMTPSRLGTKTDSIKAADVARVLASAIQQYKDTIAAVHAGFKMFAPQMKQQRVYHFTNGLNALQEAFRFDPAKPTSLLYRKDSAGTFVLIGAMYTAPKRFAPEKLDARVPTSIARWHKHVNWCVPPSGAGQRWLERKNGEPVFGPESPIATKAECDAVGGDFHASLFGWMVHANVIEPGAAGVWGDDHAGHDMHDGMKMDGAKGAM